MRFYWLIYMMLLAGCLGKMPRLSEGKVRFTCKEYDENNRDLQVRLSMFPEFDAWWYRDSFAIEEIKTLRITTENNITKKERVFSYYLFADLKAATFYLYHTFSDTAVFFSRFDTSSSQIPGIDFFISKRDLPVKKMSDTVIDGQRYKRLLSSFTNNKQEVEKTIVYEMRDRNKTMYDFGMRYQWSFSNAVSRVDFLPNNWTPHTVSWQINFERDVLSEQERRVFSAWAKNARENPVTKIGGKRNSVAIIKVSTFFNAINSFR